MRLIKCPSCNKGVSADSHFCPHCGYKFEKINSAEVSNIDGSSENDMLRKLRQEDMEKLKTIVANKTSKLKVFDWIIALIAIAIIIIGWIVPFASSGKIWIGILLSTIGLAVIFIWLFIKNHLIQNISKEETKKIINSYSKDNNK